MSYATEARGLRALARLVVLPLLGVAAGLGAASIVTAEMTPTYRATASVVVLPKEQKKASSSDLTDVSLALNVSPSVARLAESREVANTVATRLRLPETDVFGKATAVSEPGNQIVTVQAEAESPVVAARIANEVTKATTALYNQLRLSGKSGVTVQTLDSAAPPTTPTSPRPLLNYALGALVGLLIGVGVATLRSRSDDRFRGVRELEKRLGLPTLGRLRSLPRWPRDVARLYRRRGVRASIDATVAALSVLAGDHRAGGCRVLVTTVGADRPTPVVAALLAQGLARHGRRAVLVDGQPRRHGVERVIEAGAATSVSAVLDPTNDAATVRMITSTALSEHLHGHLEPEAVADLIDPLAARTDAVVITAPPVFSGRDLATLAAQVDVVVLVIDSDRVGQPEATRAGLLVRRLDVEVAGTLVLGTAVERDGAQPAVWGPAVERRTRRTARVAPPPVASTAEPVRPDPVPEPAQPEAAAVSPAVPEPVVAPAEQEPVVAPVEPEPVVAPAEPEPVVAPAEPDAAVLEPVVAASIRPVGSLATTLTSRRWPFAKPIGRHGPEGASANTNGADATKINGAKVNGAKINGTGGQDTEGKDTEGNDAEGQDTEGNGTVLPLNAPYPDDDDTHVIPAVAERARRSLPATADDPTADVDQDTTEPCPPRRVRAWAS